MNIKKIIESSKSIEENLTSVISFKIDPTIKQDFVDMCVKNNVSMGLLMRNFVRDVIKEIDN